MEKENKKKHEVFSTNRYALVTKGKNWFILSFIMLVLLGVFSSCSKDDENDNLVGTIWIGMYQEVKYSVVFNTETVVTLRMEDDYDIDTYQGTYTYNKPNVTATIDGESITGKVNGNIMNIALSNGYVFSLMKSN
jgi:hypothetical protein